MIGKKVVHHMMMSEKDAHYVGGLVNGARIVVQWGDVGTELMVTFDCIFVNTFSQFFCYL